MIIAVIDNFDSFVYNLVRYVREIPNVEVYVQRNNAIDFEILEKSDAILLSPGPGIPSEAGQLMDVIERFSIIKPILGVCLGHQALALHFGGQLHQCSNPVHGKEATMEHTMKSPFFQNIPTSFQAGRYHSWSVATPLPDCLIETAQSSNELMAFEHETLPIYGVQFHPESILTPEGRTMIENWVALSNPITLKASQL